jgi:hypothetical protein
MGSKNAHTWSLFTLWRISYHSAPYFLKLPTEKNICVTSEEDYYDDGPPHLIPFGGCSVTCGGGMQLQACDGTRKGCALRKYKPQRDYTVRGQSNVWRLQKY